MMKIGIFDRYLSTLGGGERYSCKIAEVLSRNSDYEVKLISDLYSDLSKVSERLNLDLSRVKLKIVPFVSDEYSLRITGDYDIFINATYLSAFAASAKYNIYICYFPTPFDSDFRFIHRFLLLFFKKPAKWLYKKAESMFSSFKRIEIIEGIYDLKRFMLRRGSWSNGEVIIRADYLADSITKHDSVRFADKNNNVVIRLGLKNPSDTNIDKMEVKIIVSDSQNFEDVFYNTSHILCSNEKKIVDIPVKNKKINFIKIKSNYFIPSDSDTGKQDSRRLGVVLYDESDINLYKKFFLKMLGYIPMFLVTFPSDLKFLDSYNEVISISEFSQYWIKKYWKRESRILFPPVDTESFGIGTKEKIILSVGRFFPEHHNKKQLELAHTFIGMIKKYPEQMQGFRLILAGGLENKKNHIEYVEKIKEISRGFPIDIMTNISWEALKDLFAKAMIFWHASGLNEDEKKNPAKFEHFGITTVEAMASGCIPIVINKGGQKEIINEPENGFKFNDINELMEKTINAIVNYKDMKEIIFRAKRDCEKYSNGMFEQNLLNIISKAALSLQQK